MSQTRTLQEQMEWMTDDQIMQRKARKQFAEIMRGDRTRMTQPVQNWLNRKNSVFHAQNKGYRQ